MVNEKQTKRERNIKSKLMAAIAMLLVSSIMMVSTTYAWFTLSTAPEVTGITTSVGANGNLEMALLPTDGQLTSITASVGDSAQVFTVKNVTWGNLVDVSDDYGMNEIVLNPSQLTVVTKDGNNNPTQINSTSFVAYPEYGSDGRVSALSNNAVTATYDSTDGFLPNNEFGVRAVGVSSGLTDRQLAYRNARGEASTAMSLAKNEAKKSLDANGNALANVAIKKATDNEGGYGKSDVEAMRAIVTSLEEKVLPEIEKAYAQFILAYAASAKTADDAAWVAIKGKINTGAPLLGTDGLLVEVDGTYSLNVADVTVALPAELNTPIVKLAATKANIVQADAKLEALENRLTANPDEAFDWATDISPVLSLLADPDAMKVNGQAPSEIKANLSAFAQNVMKNGIMVTMHTGGGVYADVADHCGDYEASVIIEKINYGGMEFENMDARMQTKSSLATSYLGAMSNVVTGAGAPSSEDAVARPMSETYAYIIDLAFRTNAANSNLLLQVDPADRIYSDNTNAETMGGGASMTFKATSTDFTDKNVKDLMDNIKIVFFNPDSGNVYATAKLDTANAESTADGITAELYIYSIQAATETKYNEATYVADSGLTYYTEADGKYTAIEDAAAATFGGQLYTATTTTGAAGEVKSSDNKIMALPQNIATKLSVLVYLDGETITNADVAANAASSVTGTMNLQFSSSANLIPMEYGDLHITDATVPATTTPATPEPTT